MIGFDFFWWKLIIVFLIVGLMCFEFGVFFNSFGNCFVCVFGGDGRDLMIEMRRVVDSGS